MNSRRATLWALGVLAVIVASGLAVALASGSSRPVALTPTTLAQHQISSVTDVTDAAIGSYPSFPISREKAISLAQADLGTADTNIRVLIGKATIVPGEAERDVWIVIFKGGTFYPMDGPVEASHVPQTYAASAEVFDAQTGEFYYGFMQ